MTIALIAACASPASASPPAVADPGASITDGNIKAIASAGSKVYVAGGFSAVGPRTGSALEFNSSTSARIPLPEIAGGGVSAVVADGAGGWYVGGDFDRVAGVVRYGLAHIRANGTSDPNFPQLGHEALSVNNSNDFVEALALSADGKTLYVGGSYARLGGQPRFSLGAVATASDSVTSWAPHLDGTFPSVRSLALGAGTTAGSIFAGGNFTGVDGVSAADLAKLAATNGAPDAGFKPNPTSSGSSSSADVNALALSTTGSSIYVGGYFDAIGGKTRQDLAHVDNAGANEGKADVWNPNPDDQVSSLLVQAGTGTVYAAGNFTQVGGQARDGVAAISPSTAAPTGWSVNLGQSIVNTMAFDGSNLLIQGDFPAVSGQPRHGVAVVSLATGAPNAFNPSLAGEGFTATVSGNHVLVGGDNMTAAAARRYSIAQLDPYGHPAAFAPTLTGSLFGYSVNAIAASPDGKTLYIGGYFTGVDGQPRSSLAAFSTATGALTAWHSAVSNGVVEALAVSHDGKTLYVGGNFDHLGSNNQPRSGLGAVSTLSGQATTWNPPVIGGAPIVNVLALSTDGATLYVGGRFTSAGHNFQPRLNLAAISTAGPGNTTAWAPNPQGGPSSEVDALLVAPNGTVYVGGEFQTAGANSLSRHALAAISAAATGNATAWNPGLSTSDSANQAYVHGIAFSADRSTLFVGGRFDHIGGQPRIDLAELSTANAAATAWNPDPGPYLRGVDVVALGGGTLRIGGSFLRVGNHSFQDYAQFTSPPANVVRPTVTGKASYGHTLRCHHGTFSNSPLSYAYAWTRDGHAIPGQTHTTYKVRGADSGRSISCLVAATNAGGGATAFSKPRIPGPHVGSFALTRHHNKRYFKYSITEQARVTIVIELVTKKHVTKLGSLTALAHSGTNKRQLPAKLGHHRLKAGRYEAVISARDSHHHGSNRKTVKFRLK